MLRKKIPEINYLFIKGNRETYLCGMLVSIQLKIYEILISSIKYLSKSTSLLIT